MHARNTLRCLPLLSRSNASQPLVGGLLSDKGTTYHRLSSTSAKPLNGDSPPAHSLTAQENRTALSRLPTSSILRSLVLGTFLASPILFNPGLAFLQKVTRSKSFLLNPDRNPVLRAIIKPLIYDQFCAGTHDAEIRRRVSSIRALGFSGVLLAYGKEIQIYERDGTSPTQVVAASKHDEELDFWKKGNLQTLDMLEDNDFLAMKFSGAGMHTVNKMLRNEEPSPQMLKVLDSIAQAAMKRNCRIIVDSEQQSIQRSIDRWTVEWMRKYNRGDKPVIVNTLQGYLKESRDKLIHQLSLAQQEGWTLGIKLVRGAYMSNDKRELIHDTKVDTDNSYNSIVHDVLTRSLPGFDPNNFPKMSIFLAGHNQESVDKAMGLVERLERDGELRIVPEFGQLQGMADDLGCRLLNWNEKRVDSHSQRPDCRVYKYMTWGSTQECMEYLVRRAVENRGAADRMKDDMTAMFGELKIRMTDTLMGRRTRTT
ncbi:Proline dehydrogenase-like protein 1 [Elsinoe fawcettii]|nr:Proline dehydrogenase-like protein 1 [Elsinoe fawcettii]